MSSIEIALKALNFHWKPKHLNPIAENIVFKKRNVSFLAMNALFRTKNYELEYDEPPFEKSYMIRNFVEVLPNDALRQRAEILTAIFRIDAHHNIIPITAFSEHDKS